MDFFLCSFYLCLLLSWHLSGKPQRQRQEECLISQTTCPARNSSSWNKMKNADIVQGCIHPYGENRASNYKAMHICENRPFLVIPQRWIEVMILSAICGALGCCPICQIYIVSLLGPAIILKFDNIFDSLLCSKHFLNFYFQRKLTALLFFAIHQTCM